MKKIAVIAAAVALYATTAASVGSAQQAGNTIRTIGRNSFIRNALIQSTLRFSPDRITVASGGTIRFVDRDRPKEPHTLSIIGRKSRPKGVGEVFNCKPCRVAGAHFKGGGKPKIHVNEGRPGLNRTGDSILLRPGKSESATVTAPAGKTLYYLCAIHPWMQGQIRVT